MTRILIPLPSHGFDPSEVAIPWKHCVEQGWEVLFATPNGGLAAADPIMLTGKGLGIWSSLLRAQKDAVEFYREMEASESFRNPLSYASLQAAVFDVLILPGGHAKGVREYLESPILQQLVVGFFQMQKPVAAICHGVVLAARSIDPETDHSVLHGYRTTCLLQSQEMFAYQLTRLWLQDYYRTYPGLSVEKEVRAVLAQAADFQTGPTPLLRDTSTNLERGFFVRDRNYLSARWPGDLYAFSDALLGLIQSTATP